MTDERWRNLMNDDDAPLTPAEIADGWHFCPEFDGLLIGPDMPQELSICQCNPTTSTTK